MPKQNLPRTAAEENLFMAHLLQLGINGVRLACVITLGLAFAMLVTKSAAAASLKDSAVVEDGVIRLGDLFDDVAGKEAKVLGNAPAPGKEMVVSAATLMRISHKLDLNWKPESGVETIVVKRSASEVGEQTVKDALKEALVQKGAPDDAGIILSTAMPTIVLPANAEATAEVASVNYNAARDSFDAVIVSPSKANPLKRVSLSGSVSRIVAVPVLKSTVKAGDIISAADIDWTDVPEKTAQGDIIADADKLVGMQALRLISSGKPIKTRDLKAPKMVSRGDEVTILYSVGSMQLTAKGKSMQDGANGEVIRVTNLSSNKTFAAVVADTRTVKVE